MNFEVVEYKNGRAELSWNKPPDISTNIWYSFNTKKGTQFYNKDFGLDLSDIKKVTNNNITAIHQRLVDAVQWLIDLGRAKSIDIIVEKDLQDNTRVNFSLNAVQADGVPVVIENFIEVGGASNGFAF